MSNATAPTPAHAPARATPRLESVDLLRGLIMVVMALDHVRDFFHFSALQGFDPLDLRQTTAAIFLTRWVTHFCAPNFSLLAGVGVYLAVMRGKPKGQLSYFLVTRGLWLIFLELTLLTWFGWGFALDWHLYYFATLWALGWSMIVLAALIHLPLWAILGFSLTLILGHNAFDGIGPGAFGRAGWVWQILHAGGMLEVGSFHFFAFYPLIPWLGRVYQLAPARRQSLLLVLGVGLLAAFVLLRASNVYGDPVRWSGQGGAMETLLSFLKVTKYPPSLCYLLLTLGVGTTLLALLEKIDWAWTKPFLVFGRVPFFYYVLHIPLIHAFAYVVNLWRSGRADFSPIAGTAPAGAGISLAATYAVWIGVVLLLYPACRWFAELKRRRREAWLSYF